MLISVHSSLILPSPDACATRIEEDCREREHCVPERRGLLFSRGTQRRRDTNVADRDGKLVDAKLGLARENQPP